LTNGPSLDQLLRATLPQAGDRTIGRLAAAARIRQMAPGDCLFDQGESLALTMILNGHGALRRTMVDGRHYIVAIAKPGQLLGVGSATDSPSPVCLAALTPGVVATWPGGVLRPLIGQDAGLALDIIEIVVERAFRTTERLDEYLYDDARKRILRVLAEHRELFFGDPPLVSRTVISSVVGVSREMTSRVIRSLEREGLVARVGSGGLRLLEPSCLDRAASD
jgi:CRP-like cAMP-binding protein